MDKMVESISSNTFAKLYARLIGKDKRKKRILEIPRKEDPSDSTKREFKDFTRPGSW
jgi:hypothetical protein